MTQHSASLVSDADLHAYVDDRLSPERRADIEAWLVANPEEAQRVAAWQAQTEDLRAHFAPALSEPVPPALAVVFMAKRRRDDAFRRALQIAAVLLVSAAASGGGWWARGYVAAPQPAALPQEAARAHLVYSREVLHPVEVTAAEEQHLVAWLSKRLGTALTVPSLSAEGYNLVGGRLLPAATAGGAAAQFMYETRQGQRLTLYVRSGEAGEDTSFRFVAEGQAAAFYWVDGGFGYALTGEAGRAALCRWRVPSTSSSRASQARVQSRPHCRSSAAPSGRVASASG